MATMKNREPLPAFYSDPQIRHLPQVLEEIHRGQILIPRFQRPLVWSKEMRLALLDSILEGIPIGTIMVWRTRSIKVLVREQLGPFLLPRSDEDAPVHQYLLDGEQRLTTLYFALFGVEPAAEERAEDDEEPQAFQVYYDLRALKFVSRSDLKQVLPHHLPMTDLLQGPKLVRFQRALSNAKPPEAEEGESYPDIDQLMERSDEVSDAFRQYKFPVVPVTSEDLDLVTRTFKRVNSQHVTMSEVHMVNALTWSTSFDLLERLQRMKEVSLVDWGWDDLEDQTILRVCKVVIGAAVYDDNAEAVSNTLKGNPEILGEVEEHLYNTAAFLRAECGVRAPGLVPYTAQIVLLAAAFQEVPGPSAEIRALLRDWFWLTTYTEMFQRSMSESRFSQLREEVRALARGILPSPSTGKPLNRRRLPRFDFRHARARGTALLLAERKPRDPSAPGVEVDGADLLAEYHVRAVPQLVTSSMVGAALSSSPGARVLVRPESISTMRKMLQLSSPPVEFLKSHVIDGNMLKAFHDGAYGVFVRMREQELNRMEYERFQQILKRLYPTAVDSPGS